MSSAADPPRLEALAIVWSGTDRDGSLQKLFIKAPTHSMKKRARPKRAMAVPSASVLLAVIHKQSSLSLPLTVNVPVAPDMKDGVPESPGPRLQFARLRSSGKCRSSDV